MGIARGLAADSTLNQAEVEFLQKWLAANLAVSNEPLVGKLYQRVNEILADGVADHDELSELLETLNQLSNTDMELGEVLKSTTLPICRPPPQLNFQDKTYCFTGTFNYGSRKQCEEAVMERGGAIGSITKKTNALVIGVYATESWKHSSFGNKILKACEYRDNGVPISIVSEQHWVSFL